MIYVGKSPYRISLLGGGSDLDWFVESEGFGCSLGYSLDQYSYTVLHPLPSTAASGVLNYSSRETYQSVNSIVHPLIRLAFEQNNLDCFVELSSFGFASGGSGLGGSSSFLLSLLAALHQYQSIPIDRCNLAKSTSDIEIYQLDKPIGRQDQYFSALGGLNALQFQPAGNVKILELSPEKTTVLARIINNLYLVPSFKTRSADKVLQSLRGDPSSIVQFRALRDIAFNFINLHDTRDSVIECAFHRAVADSWHIKMKMSNVMDDQLVAQCTLISQLPINWIRLIGAGSGGYFLVSPKDCGSKFISLMRDIGFSTIYKASLSPSGVSACAI